MVDSEDKFIYNILDFSKREILFIRVEIECFDTKRRAQ
jgi:hypothetical protein